MKPKSSLRGGPSWGASGFAAEVKSVGKKAANEREKSSKNRSRRRRRFAQTNSTCQVEGAADGRRNAIVLGGSRAVVTENTRCAA